jgi:RHS repeat-associated protein
MLNDGLGSVRGVWNTTNGIEETRHYSPYGELFGGEYFPYPSRSTYGFTGELTDHYGYVYLRARHLNPDLGIFPSLDPVEGFISRPMSINGYTYVEGNPANWRDPSGKFIGALLIGVGGGALLSSGFELGSQIYSNIKNCDMSLGDALDNIEWDDVRYAATRGAVLGGITGVAGWSMAGMGFSPLTTFATGGLIDTAFGSAWDVVIGCEDPETALLNNLIENFILGGVLSLLGYGVYRGFGKFGSNLRLGFKNTKLGGLIDRVSPRIGKWLDLRLGHAEAKVRFGRNRAITDKIPRGWNSKPAKDGVGWRWINPDPAHRGAHSVRVDMGDPSVKWPTSQVDHVHVRQGDTILRDGRRVGGNVRHVEVNGQMVPIQQEDHIPLSDWLTWTNWYQP